MFVDLEKVPRFKSCLAFENVYEIEKSHKFKNKKESGFCTHA
jgi:hypothetical protein